jgi:hypothetical protein
MKTFVLGFAAGAAVVYYLPQIKQAFQGVQVDGLDGPRAAVADVLSDAAEKVQPPPPKYPPTPA